MGSYYLRFWKDAFESGVENLVVNNCFSAPGGEALGRLVDVNCEFDTTTVVDGTYVFSAQFLDSDIQWGSALRTFIVDNTPPEVPVHVSPADDSFQNINDFYFDWTDVEGAVEYEFQTSQNPAVDEGGVLTTGVWQNTASGDPEQSFLDESEIHSYGANGTWHWQVRAIDEAGNESDWREGVHYYYEVPAVITEETPNNQEETRRRSGGRVSAPFGSSSGQVLGASTGVCSMYLNSYMKEGDASNDVKLLQTFLNSQGISVPVTGYFGPLTKAAVITFQNKYADEVLKPWGLTEGTGLVYKTTRWKINNLNCEGSEAFPVL